jgi:hypothetical protein
MHISWSALAGLAAVMLAGSAAADPAENDLRQFRVGMPVTELPSHGYVDLACSSSPERTLKSWADYAVCPADGRGLHGVSFRYDESEYPLAAMDDRYEGTKVAGHPVTLTLLIGNDRRVDGLEIATDPKVRLYLRKKAFLFAGQVKSRYGEEGWTCTSQPPAGDEEPVGGVFVKEHCEKKADQRHFILESELFRHAGQDLKDFVSGARLTILHAG